MKLAIKGHETRGKEVIQLLEMLGGVNYYGLEGTLDNCPYYIYNNKIHHWADANVENFIVFTLEEFEKKFPYKIGDIVKCHAIWKGLIESMEWYEGEVVYSVRSYSDDYLTSVIAKHLQPYKEETNNKPKSYAVGLKDGKVIECGVNMKDNKATGSRIDFSLTERIELDLGDTHEVVVENGKTYVVKKKPQYPKTYEECCEVLGISRHDVEIDLPQPYQQKMFNLFKLHICLDAYWKIAGEQMGLGKPWEPDWMNSDFKYCLKKMGYNIGKLNEKVISCILAFPTPEMRDAFYENFKDLIEECKELL